MSKTTTIALALVASLLGANAAMAQDLSRADVVASLQAARDNGELAAFTAEKGTEGLAANKSTKTRAEVVAELKAVVANNQLTVARADAELGFVPAARKSASATMLAGK